MHPKNASGIFCFLKNLKKTSENSADRHYAEGRKINTILLYQYGRGVTIPIYILDMIPKSGIKEDGGDGMT